MEAWGAMLLCDKTQQWECELRRGGCCLVFLVLQTRLLVVRLLFAGKSNCET